MLLGEWVRGGRSASAYVLERSLAGPPRKFNCCFESTVCLAKMEGCGTDLAKVGAPGGRRYLTPRDPRSRPTCTAQAKGGTGARTSGTRLGEPRWLIRLREERRRPLLINHGGEMRLPIHTSEDSIPGGWLPHNPHPLPYLAANQLLVRPANPTATHCTPLPPTSTPASSHVWMT